MVLFPILKKRGPKKKEEVNLLGNVPGGVRIG